MKKSLISIIFILTFTLLFGCTPGGQNLQNQLTPGQDITDPGMQNEINPGPFNQQQNPQNQNQLDEQGRNNLFNQGQNPINDREINDQNQRIQPPMEQNPLGQIPMIGQEATQGTGYKNTKIQWGFKKIAEKQPEIPPSWAELLRKYDGYYIGDTNEKKIYLTFDEGYENGFTPQILDVLKEMNVPAAFFITGPYLKTEQELVKRMVNEGHIVGNHTVNHPSMPDVTSDEKLEKELTELDKNFYELTSSNMKYLRPPKGEFSERTLALAQKAGYKTILWSNAYVDWTNNGNSPENAFEKVTKYLHNGCIILLHAVSEDNAKALPEIINYARQKGYTFVGLDDL